MEVEGVGGRKSRTVLRKDLAEVIEPRAEETLQLIQNDLRLSGLVPLLGSGIVLTGGASQLEGLIEMGEFVLDIPVRRGTAIHSQANLGGITEVVKPAAFSTAVGILKYAMSKKKYTKATSVQDDMIGESLNSVGNKIKTFFEQMF